MMEVLNAQSSSTGEFTPFTHHEFTEIGSFDAERQAVFLALQSMNFNLTLTAEVLGMSRSTLYSKMKKYNITSQRQASKDNPLMK
ncbi:hypothetical protein PS662_01581 [Pseudomonas fluorescens]|uniref:DNA binding HTH domain-containing protein n=1 Tax=Pseudomonas fluorescens TaxID=294 RepID=A0A5E6RCH5_PSEFL|nr:helix-turn-helix domain-containing protein [Pseudomonas fluorescens]VVM66594.1 hypothetical protein PS662_01581 [Pseudomonas fluorescens]